MRRALWALALAASVALAACATTPAPAPRPTAGTGRPSPHPAEKPPPPSATGPAIEAGRPTPTPHSRQGASLSSLPGWAEEDHVAALAAFQAGCGAARDAGMQPVCAKARALGQAGESAARNFFEANFRVEPAGDPPGAEGVLTAYFAPEYAARDAPDGEFSAPVRPKPAQAVPFAAPSAGATDDEADDPIAAALSRPAPTFGLQAIDLAGADRASIDQAPPNGALAWMRPEDLFFLQIQGSGVLVFPDGRRMKAAYAADNGRPFVAIARPMVNRGLLGGSGASGDAIRAWLAAHRGSDAQAIMWLNPRYVFFSLAPDDGREPAGAAGVPLPPGRSIAVDPSRHAYGELFWIDAQAPVLAGAAKTYRRLAVALDTGSAIRGDVRADLYVGRGASAGAEAGRVRHALHLMRLAPVQREAQAPALRGPQVMDIDAFVYGSAGHATAAQPGGG